jgi:hypothetical protein
MAILYDQATGADVILRSPHVFGRHALKCDTVLGNVDASHIHATILWNGAAWELRDHSRNGTLVDGKRLAANRPHGLAAGQRIQFGPASTHTFRVASLDAPSAMLVPLGPDAGAPVALERAHLLPGDAQPEGVILRRADGRWIWDSADGSRALATGDTVRTSRHAWTFILPSALDATLDAGAWPLRARTACFHFTVSQDEEHTRLVVQHGDEWIDLGERTHHYALLILARQRRDDAARALDETSQGWIDIARLSRMLGLDASHLNIQIFRARKQLAQALPEPAAADCYIERRRGDVRFGAFQCRITHGSRLEEAFTPAPAAAAEPAHAC